MKESSNSKTPQLSGDSNLALEVPEDILVIHISDLHIGLTHRFPIGDSRQRGQLGVRFGRAIKAAAKQLALSVDRAIVVVTGDLTNTGQPEEFEWAIEILQGMGGEIGIGNNRFVVCPGNHDIDWLECQIAELQGKQKKLGTMESRAEIDRRKLDNYRRFLRDFYGDNYDIVARPIVRDARRQDFDDLRLSVISVNACERESHKKEDHVGFVSDEQAQAICDSWLNGSERDWIHVLAVHHNPDRTAPDNLEEIRKWLTTQDKLEPEASERLIADIGGFLGKDAVRRAAQDARVSVLMHGHQHESDVRSWKWSKGGETLILGAGSSGVKLSHLPGEQPNQIRLIAIRPSSTMIQVRTLVWDPRARQEGIVSAGDFTEGTGDRDHYDGTVYIPPASTRTSKSSGTVLHSVFNIQLQGFLETYRQRLKHTWADWDLKGMAAVGGMGKPVAAGLDEMYQPLRLGPPSEDQPGAMIEARDLIRFTPKLLGAVPKAKKRGKKKGNKQYRALLVRGPAGVGKTTWMRYTFRRLLEDPGAVPFMLVLRDVAARWSAKDCSGSERSLDACIRDSVAERMGEGWNKDLFLSVLTATEGPVPVLLVDGWDELGDHGQKLREMLLGFMQQHPRVRVVVSTRPWGEGVPDGIHGFVVLEVKPLSDQEVKAFATRFFRVCYRLDDGAVNAEVGRFLERLRASTEAESLARTALFLTMMLVVSRHKPLPDKRHQLYRECLITLLTDRPDTWAREGVQRNHDWWRPEDAEQRWKAVARLAAELQSKGYGGIGGPRKAVVASEADIVAALPTGWKPEHKRGFLWWLIGEAGLLTDRADGSYTFAHLSFQEYLTAWHLHASVSDGNWASPVLNRIGSESWWETLLLYAAEVGSTSDERADSIVQALVKHGAEAISVAGMILADGGGKDGSTEIWAKALTAGMEWDSYPQTRGRCAAAWASSQQSERRSILSAAIVSASSSARWFHWLRLSEFARLAKIQPPIPPPSNRMAAWALAAFSQMEPPATAEVIALSRILPWLMSVGQMFKTPQLLLQFWPSRRRRLGTRLQAAVLAGAPVESLVDLARLTLQGNDIECSDMGRSEDTLAFTRVLEELILNTQKQLRSVIMQRGLTRQMSRVDEHDHSLWMLFERTSAAREYLTLRSADRSISHGVIDSYFGPGKERLIQYLASLAGDDFIHSRPWLRGYLCAEMLVAMKWIQEFLFYSDRKKHLSSFGGESAPIWAAALVRHLAGEASENDRVLLIELASHPAKADPTLSLALQYFVRGDILLEDGTTIVLEDFLNEHGLPALPLLEETELTVKHFRAWYGSQEQAISRVLLLARRDL